ncbi:MAG TPA: NHL repeat-containing protein [Candidatus Binataceae bacterium]|nr:NHL repeat-containing protein [Candidatus Binataceae bacterium]
MNLRKFAGIVALLYATIIVAAPMSARAGGRKSTGTIVVANYDVASSIVTAYPAGSHGNVAPSEIIVGRNTGLAAPWGIAVDSNGYVYVTNAISNGTVTVYAPGSGGNASPVATMQLGFIPGGFAVDSSGYIYMPGEFGYIYIYAPFTPGSDEYASPIAMIGGDKTEIDWPSSGLGDIAFDSSGNLYGLDQNVVEGGFDSIVVFAPGSVGNVAPIAKIGGSNGEMNFPESIAVDSKGYIYVVNRDGGPSGNGSVTIYSPGSNGNVAPYATIKGSRTGLNEPIGVAVDSAGKIYVTNFATPRGPHSMPSITVYAPKSHGNVKPIAKITGNRTGLIGPYGITIGSAGPKIGCVSTVTITLDATSAITCPTAPHAECRNL